MTILWEEIADSEKLEPWNENEIEEDSELPWISGPSGVVWVQSPRTPGIVKCNNPLKLNPFGLV